MTPKKASSFLILMTVFILSACVTPFRLAGDETRIPENGLVFTESMEDATADQLTEENQALLSSFPANGQLELRIVMDLETRQECVKTYPFTLRLQDGRILLTGEDQVSVDCHFKGSFCDDACGELNVVLDLHTRVDGEIVAQESGEGEEALTLFYFYDGELVEFYTGFPDDIPVTFTETMPLREPAGDMPSVAMPFTEGASARLMGGEMIIHPETLPVPLDALVWDFTLHFP